MKKKFLSIFIALVLVLSFSLVTAVPVAASPGVWHVSSDGSIQDAIDNYWQPGDIIEVDAGTYVEDLVIPDTHTNLELRSREGDNVTIKGVDTLAWANWPLPDPNIDILASGVKIHGFTIESPDVANGYYSSGIVLNGTNIEIYDNSFVSTGTGDAGCVVIQTYRDNVLGYNSDISGLNIHDNQFSGTLTGGWVGVFINHTLTGTGTVTVQDNDFSGTPYQGVVTERDNTVISGNSIITDMSATGYGIMVMDWDTRAQDNVQVTGNTIKGSTASYGFDYGMLIGRTTPSLQTLTNISITENTIEGNDTGVLVRSSADGVVVNNNSIISNTLGVENIDAATLDVTSNWWGTTIEAEIAAMVSGAVTYTGWLTAAPSWVEMTATSSPATPPTVTTSDATLVAFTLATLNGNLTDMGTADEVVVSFNYGTTPGLPDFGTTPVVVTGTGAFEAPITALTPGETYYFTVAAVGNDMVVPVYGAELSFTTAVITTLDATDIGAYTATLNGSVELGSATSVDVSFNWGTDPTLATGANTAFITMGASGDFSAELTLLDLGATYYFRAKGKIGGDTQFGVILSFVTVQRLGISVSPTSIDFGDITAGHSSATKTVTVTNEGDASQIFTTSLEDELPLGFYTANLKIDGFKPGTGEPAVEYWITLEVLPAGSVVPGLVLSIPIGETVGAKTATLIFWAEAY